MQIDDTQNLYTSDLCPSNLEILLLLDGKARFEILDDLDPASIARLARVSTCLYGIITVYRRFKWNVQDILSHFVFDTEELLSVIKSTNALIFGPSVLQFFDRRPLSGNTIHICAPYEHAQALQSYLRQESFQYRSKTSMFTPFLQDMATNLSNIHSRDHAIEDERHLNQADYDSHVYSFQWSSGFRRKPPRISFVDLHLVRCDPIQHILSFHSSEHVNPFPNRKN